MRNILLSATFLFISDFAYSQNTIKGKLIDESNNEPLPFAIVTISELNKTVQTDNDGNFFFEGLKEGSYNLKITYLGYATISKFVTVKTGKEVNLGNLRMKSDAVGIDAIEIFADYLDEDKQIATPTTTITAEDIDQRLGAQEFTEMLKSTPGVFVNTAGGSFGSSNIRIRGFTSENTAVLINGIPVNDMESGAVFWSNWSGMNDVTRNQQVQRGLGASKLAVNSVGGTINIITKATDFKKGVRATYGRANRAFTDQAMVTASTGLMKNGWAFTALGSRRWGWGFREGTKVDAYSYFLTSYKEVGSHQFMLTAFGGPQYNWGGRNATQNSYDVMDIMNNAERNSFLGFNTGSRISYNPAWGYQNGEIRSAAVNRYHKPVFMANHYYDINEKTKLSTALYYSFGKGGGTTIDRTGDATIRNPIPFNLQYCDQDEGEIDSVCIRLRQSYQVQWDKMIEENKNNIDTLTYIGGVNGNTISGARSNYVLVDSRNDHKWFGAISTLNTQLDEKTELTLGLDYRWYRGYHYRTVEDLLGGDFWIDRQRFNNNIDNNLLRPNYAAQVGDTVGYNYNGTVSWMGFFSQVKRSIEKLDVFATLTGSHSYYYRTGFFMNEEFVQRNNDGTYTQTSLGTSEVFKFLNYTLKGGANYRINGRHNVFFNAGQFTRPPFFRYAFADNRVSNLPISEYTGNKLQNEMAMALEAGYSFRTSKLKANFNIYRVEWKNRTYMIGFASNDFGGDFVNYVMNGMGALHQGVEVDARYSLNNKITLRGMLSVGDWRWKNNANAVVLEEPGLRILDTTTIYIDKLKIGGTPQTTSSVGMHYRAKKGLYYGGDINVFAKIFADYNPEEKSNPEPYFNQVQQLPNDWTMDVYAGKSWKFDKTFLQLKINVNNVFGHQFITDSQQRMATVFNPSPTPFVQYYFGRTYFVSLVFNY